jgi:hypothetical protein
MDLRLRRSEQRAYLSNPCLPYAVVHRLSGKKLPLERSRAITTPEQSTNILKFPVSSPADISPLQKLKDTGYDAAQIIAVVGKCEGTYYLNLFVILWLIRKMANE